MTEKIYVGTAVDCNVIRLAVDWVLNMPMPPQSGQLVVSPEVAEQRRVAWFAMTQAERDAIIALPNAASGYQGWTLEYSDLVNEYPPGTRKACFIPSDIASQISIASAAGRTLTIAQALALTAAQAVWLDSYPENWTVPE